MQYKYSDGRITVSREMARKAYCDGKEVYIGCQTMKDGGAYWDTRQFLSSIKRYWPSAKMNTLREEFIVISKWFRFMQCPGVKTRYSVQESEVA